MWKSSARNDWLNVNDKIPFESAIFVYLCKRAEAEAILHLLTIFRHPVLGIGIVFFKHKLKGI